MENKQYVKIAVLALALWPALVFGYDNDFTHPLLTSEALKLFNTNSTQKLNENDIASVVRGSKDEDDIPRWLEHFYDPINNRGLNAGQFATSKEWAHGRNSTGNDYSWENAIYNYVYGNKQQGLYAFGHVIHLVQDATVPDHTRDDVHVISKTYEAYSQNQTRVPASTPIYLNSLNAYFDSAANFSNSNFFSDDTILANYQNPKIERESIENKIIGGTIIYGYGRFGRLATIRRETNNDGELKVHYSLEDTNDGNKVMSDYWSVLAPKAVGYSAGVVELFLKEVEKEKETGTLKKERMPWWEKLLDLVKIRVDQVLASVNFSLGEGGPIPTPINLNFNNQIAGPEIPNTPKELEKKVDPEKGKIDRLKELQSQLRRLQIELSNLSGKGEQIIVPILNSANTILASVGVPVVEADNSTTTATTTEPVLPLALNFSITECALSLAPDFCLLKSTSTLNFKWSPTKAGDYQYDLMKATDDDWDLVWEKVGTFSEQETMLALDLPAWWPADELKWQVIAREASSSDIVASSSEITTVFHPRPIVINEIGWAGTMISGLDEWIELRNYLTDYPLKLSDYYITDNNKTWQINLSGEISPNNYYLIERGSDEVISNRPANLIDNFVADFGRKAFNPAQVGLKLWHKNNSGDEVVDETPLWDKSQSGYGSIERNFEDRISSEFSTWEENPGCNEGDGPCALDRNSVETFGTPGVINRASIPRLW